MCDGGVATRCIDNSVRDCDLPLPSYGGIYFEGEEMKILIEESVLRQTLEKLELCWCVGSDKSEWDSVAVREFDETITALRAALDAAEGVDPVMEVLVDKDGYVDGSGWKLYGGMQPGWNKLYPAPAVPEKCKHEYIGAGLRPKFWRCLKCGEVKDAAPTPPTNMYSDIVSDGGLDPRDMRPGKIEFIPDDSELRDAARAVVENYRNLNTISEEIDRLRKAL